jgi:sporulation protein YlmC with PRC-barrel domain
MKKARKKRQLSTQCLVSQLRGRIIFDRHDLRGLAIVEHVIFRAEDLGLAYFTCRAADIPKAYIRADQTTIFGKYLATNDVANFGEADEFVRDQHVITSDCQLTGYRVIDTLGHHLGKVNDVSVSMAHLQVSRLHVRPPLLRSWKSTNLVIARSAVVEVLPESRTITVQGPEKTHTQLSTEPSLA